MPQFYYQTTPREEKVRDLHAVITGHIFESKQTLQLWNRNRSKTTFLAPGNDDQIFQDIVSDIAGLRVKHGSMFTSNDRLLLISSFFTEKFKKVDLSNQKCNAKVQKAIELLSDDDHDEVTEFITNLDHDMVVHATPSRMARLFKLYHLAKDREDAVTHLVPKYFHEYSRLDIAYKKMPISKTVASILALFERYGFTLNRSVMATVNDQTDTPITILTFIIRHKSGKTDRREFCTLFEVEQGRQNPAVGGHGPLRRTVESPTNRP